MGTGDPSGAAGVLETLRARPQYPPITDYYIGHAFLRMGDEARAREAFKRFLETWEGDPALSAEAKILVDRLAP
ncbi:MAG: hypothetical protein MZU95_00570 [Desulfomicrobium escambiense]|nr:hypothetical protein [Desulfomicrobium escambiense]